MGDKIVVSVGDLVLLKDGSNEVYRVSSKLESGLLDLTTRDGIRNTRYISEVELIDYDELTLWNEDDGFRT